MATAREAVRLGLAARGQAKVKVRQPLREAVVVAAGREREAIERLADVVRDELNVREVRFVSEADELGSYDVKPNYRTLGPRFGKWMPQVAAAVEALDPSHVGAVVRDGGTIGVNVDGRDHQLTPDDFQLALRPLEGYQLEREGSHAVALDLTLDDELRREGLVRDIVRAVQLARQAAGLDISDRIALTLAGDPALVDAAREHEDYVAGETLATVVVYADDANGGGEPAVIDGRELHIAVARA
jgi:isoleucyl-tRNA synthetase